MCRGGQSVQYQFNPPLRMHVAAPRARSAAVARAAPGRRRMRRTRGRAPRDGDSPVAAFDSHRRESAEAPSPNALQDVGVRLSDGTVGLASVF